jgi:3'-phosphoadenosine 5'-phosphosulfate sulfotransferase (PAPS reductase)/FAD synthetase
MTAETVAFWSGHANSSAMVLRMCEINQHPDVVVHACTGLEFDFVYNFMEMFQKICPVEIILEDVTKEKQNLKFDAFFNQPWCRGKHTGEIHGMPKAMNPCWHNRNVKQPVFNKWEERTRESYTGFHVGERHRCMNNHHKKRYPLIEWGWTAKDSIEYLRKRGIPHLGYDKYGFERLGCYLCPKQDPLALYIIYKNFPDMFMEMMEMEKKSPHGFRKGKSLEEMVDIWESQVNYTIDKFSAGEHPSTKGGAR